MVADDYSAGHRSEDGLRSRVDEARGDVESSGLGSGRFRRASRLTGGPQRESSPNRSYGTPRQSAVTSDRLGSIASSIALPVSVPHAGTGSCRSRWAAGPDRPCAGTDHRDAEKSHVSIVPPAGAADAREPRTSSDSDGFTGVARELLTASTQEKLVRRPCGGDQKRSKNRSSTWAEKVRLSIGTRSSMPWNRAQKLRSGGRSKGLKPKHSMPRRCRWVASVPPASM